MLKLATILNNPGEPVTETRYRDPRQLQQLGYNGLVIYETTGLSGIDSPAAISDREMRQWVDHQFEIVGHQINQAVGAGLDVYIFYDVLSLPKELVLQKRDALTCRKHPQWLCPASDLAIELSVKALGSLLKQWPSVAGVVLRFGDNDAARLPYLIGNEIYKPHCSRCSQLGSAQRISLILENFYQLVVQKLNKTLIARAWNIGPNGMHDCAQLCRQVADMLPDDFRSRRDNRFIWSFKFTHTDFWRYQPWNRASLVWGDQPILYELQCQREFEGKGGLPNWQVPLWRNGATESAQWDGGGSKPLAGLANLGGEVNLAGLWAWVRGGGWGGPFTKNETWVDANVFAVPRLAQQPDIQPAKLADQWIESRFSIKDPATVGAIRQVLEHSPDVILKGFYIGPFAQAVDNHWHPNADWVQDDLVNAKAAWQIIQNLPESQLDQVVQEKQDAVDQTAGDRAKLQQRLDDHNQSEIEPLVNTLIYAESFYAALRDLLAGLVAYRRYLKSGSQLTAQQCVDYLRGAQRHWNHHTQRHGSLPGAATAFREEHFWELTQQILTRLNDL